MKIRYFKYGYGRAWELNLIGNTYNLRIAKFQFAFWKNEKPIFNFLRDIEVS